MKERMLLKIRFYPIANTAEIRFLPRNGKLHTGGYLLVFLFFVSRKIVWYWYLLQFDSSDLSLQSGSLSHRKWLEIQLVVLNLYVLQENWPASHSGAARKKEKNIHWLFGFYRKNFVSHGKYGDYELNIHDNTNTISIESQFYQFPV